MLLAVPAVRRVPSAPQRLDVRGLPARPPTHPRPPGVYQGARGAHRLQPPLGHRRHGRGQLRPGGHGAGVHGVLDAPRHARHQGSGPRAVGATASGRAGLLPGDLRHGGATLQHHVRADPLLAGLLLHHVVRRRAHQDQPDRKDLQPVPRRRPQEGSVRILVHVPFFAALEIEIRNAILMSIESPCCVRGLQVHVPGLTAGHHGAAHLSGGRDQPGVAGVRAGRSARPLSQQGRAPAHLRRPG